MQNSTTNVLRAFATLADRRDELLTSGASSHNRANQMGEKLENYTKCLFADAFDESEEDRPEIYSRCFSYLGNNNNPPDMIIRNGDAIEVKKIERRITALALNSSHPKDVLHSDDSRITADCRNCEDWTEKDMFYIIGHTNKQTLEHLWMIQGKCYAAKRDTYERLSTKMSEAIYSAPDIDFAQTNELAKIDRIDPLGITNLRIRGMWQIVHPEKVFNYISQSQNNYATLLLLTEKYYSYPESDRRYIEESANDGTNRIKIADVRIMDPNNPANLLDAKIITLNDN